MVFNRQRHGDFGGGLDFINVNTLDGNGSPKFGKANFFADVLINQNRVGDAVFGDDETGLLNNTRTEKASRGIVRVIEMSAAGSSSLTVEDHVILAMWIGATGTYILNLPSLSTSIDGQQYEIIIDENFVTETNIELTPADGDLIRGETEEIVNGSGSNTRFFLRATTEGWY